MTHEPLLFSGIEVEGKYKGLKTLFVQGDVDVDAIDDTSGDDDYL